MQTEIDETTSDFNTQALQIVSEFQAGRITFEDAKDQSSELYGTLGLDIKEFTRRLLPQIDALYEINAKQTIADQVEEPAPDSNAAKLQEFTNVGDEDIPPNAAAYPDAEGETDPSFEGEVGRRNAGPRSEGGKWFFGTSSKSTLDAYTRRTLDLQKEFRDDLSNARTYIMADGLSPILPKSVWTAILENGYVDFAKINGSRDAVVVEEHSSAFGEFVVSTKDRSPSSPVKAYYEWDLCYELFSQAVAIAYPHREPELKKYRRLILQIFNDHSLAAHPQVILYDQNIRFKIAGNAQLRLTDDATHQSMYNRFFSASGIRNCFSGPQNGSSAPRKSEPVSNEVCRNWNRGTCTRPAGTCKFRHQCSDCRGSHPAGSTSCSKASPGTGGRVPKQRNAIQASLQA